MQLLRELVTFAALLACARALPLQVAQKPGRTGSSAAESADRETIFAKILKANQGSTALLKEGDIHLVMNRNAMICPIGRCFWPKSSNGRVQVPYTFSDVYTNNDRAVIQAGMQEFSTMTCVDFITRTTEFDYLLVVSGSGCWSYIGWLGGAQRVTLSQGDCMLQGIAEHELMHSLGFYHEHTRTDRDTYIDIMWQYINQEDQVNFYIDVGNLLDLPYDYNSVMHYNSHAYSNTSWQATIVTKPQNNIPIGQRYGLSNLDVAKINKLYNCNLCRSLLSDPSGTFNFTVSTSQGSSCLWLIRIHNNRVFLLLNDYNILPSNGCRDNYLRVYNGNSKTSPVLLDNTCGRGKGLTVLAPGSTMLVEFVYSGQLSSQSLNAEYHSAQCGGTYTSMSGTVTSPNYPGVYPAAMTCYWSIVAPPGYSVSLHFVAFTLERQTACQFDYLKIYDDGKTGSPLLGTYCLSSPGNLISVGNTLRLEFQSDYSMAYGGFLATYNFFRAANVLTNTTGRLFSPGYPFQYPNNMHTLWLIQLPSVTKIFLWFTYLDVQSSVGCASDYIKVYDGSNVGAPVLLDKTCTESMLRIVVSSGNSMLVEFVSDGAISGRGFLASYGTG